MPPPIQQKLAKRFRELNQQPLLLPGIWDTASALLFEKNGYQAIGTSSAALAYSQGFADGQGLTLDNLLPSLAAITAKSQLPLSVDIESGYQDLSQTVQAVLEAGAVGINLEDSLPGKGLIDVAEQCQRIGLVRDLAERFGLPLFINARTDTYLLATDHALEESLCRAAAYQQAGADMIFVPTVSASADIKALVQTSPIPVNLMALPGCNATDWFALGVTRVSLGLGPILAVLGLLDAIAAQCLHQGHWPLMDQYHFGFAKAQMLFS
ncbi:isocitrate lyase/PEP mutase family protein [Gallaecimonas mangrovi]|uniref:isocitrate lyase/PEP mutase family protein n=1 Tax=Gallaecimonas mangrovi TaxID=2291597 RepID=UPI000E200567|nr:isocitrate lyase/phosphoenolpyruvate mutase family protein [Gallaecimonas mangrovi]